MNTNNELTREDIKIGPDMEADGEKKKSLSALRHGSTLIENLERIPQQMTTHG